VPAIVRRPPNNAQRRAEWVREYADRNRVVKAETTSSMLNSDPAALPDNPAFTSRLLIKTGIRKRLVVAMNWDPIAGSTISLSRFLVKMVLKPTPLPGRSVIHIL
jgi:hypothetical protein